VAAKGIRASKAPAATPLASDFKVTLADEFLFAAVQTFMAFTVVLARKGLAAEGAYKGSLVCVRAQVRA
jgi:hypothetical protein